ncbi:MAG: cysteine hydrolase, partial [Anaerolineales bacterium]|nr:cysteine hydrolase [Anaerolineales bacterium]
MNKIALMKPGQTALLVIDVQRALFTRPQPIFKAYQLLETINALVSRSHLYGVQVFYIQHANQSYLVEGSDGWQIHPDLSPSSADKIIKKNNGNAFLETTLQGDLEARGIENLLITGLVTNQCVRATSLGGMKLG